MSSYKETAFDIIIVAGQSNAQILKSFSDTAHFCDKSVSELADRYFEEYRKIIN